MGTKDLRDAFNAEAEGVFTCSVATLGYERKDGAEWQILTFSGTAADGSPFATQSEHLKPGTDVNLAARAAARALIDKGKPAP